MYKREYYCRRCQQPGHNVRTCPKVKEKAAEGSIWDQKRLQRNEVIGHDRNCSYCSGSGHNKQTCQQLQADKIKKIFEISRCRKSFLELMNKYQIGPGALLDLNDVNHGNLLVETIVWERIGPDDVGNIIYRDLQMNKQVFWTKRYNIGEYLFAALETGSYKVIIPSQVQFDKTMLPEKYLSGILGLDNFWRHG